MRFLIGKKNKIINLVAFLSLFIIFVSCTHNNETEQLLKKRYREYKEAYDQMNYSESYKYLSPTSKENITPEEWGKIVFKYAGK